MVKKDRPGAFLAGSFFCKSLRYPLNQRDYQVFFMFRLKIKCLLI